MEKDPVEAIGGSALKVYLVLLENSRPMGVRELQRRMGFKSPAAAKHHLDRLCRLGLVKRVEDGYIAVKPSSASILSMYMLFMGKMIPRIFPMAAFAIATLLTYIVLRIVWGTASELTLLTILVLLTVMLIIHSLEMFYAIRRLAGE